MQSLKCSMTYTVLLYTWTEHCACVVPYWATSIFFFFCMLTCCSPPFAVCNGEIDRLTYVSHNMLQSNDVIYSKRPSISAI